MKRILAILSVLLICNCGLLTDEQDAINAAGALGFTDIKVIGSSLVIPRISGCSKQDAAAYEMTGKNPQGMTVKMTACVGWPCKGTTIRFQEPFLYWLTKAYWQYLLAKKSPDYSWIEVLLCRVKGHTDVWWFNPEGLEPDMHCRGCGDNLA